MKRFLLVALVATALGTSSGCCRGWFIWPGQYPHNPAFSQCCDPPWGPPDPFHDHRPHAKAGWGHGPYGDDGDGGNCCYNSCGIADWFHHDGSCGCGCGSAPQGYPPGVGYPGMNYGMAGPGPSPGMPGPGAGMYGPGMYPQPAPDAMSAGQVAYPYYTTRGPRDFLLGYPPGSRPPSIGP